MSSPKESILILGAGTMQIPALVEARALGYLVIGVDGNPNAPGRQEADIFFPIDLKDTAGIVALIRAHKLEDRIAGVFTAGTDFSLSVAQLAQALGLPGNSLETARRATDKGLMRECFNLAGVKSPDFFVVHDGLPLEVQLARMVISAPLVIKPVDSMGARGVVKITDTQYILPAITQALHFSRSGQVIVEQFIDGPEFSIDALFHEGELLCWAMAVRHIQFPPVFIETGHSFPHGLSDEVAASLLEEFLKGVKAIGIENGAAKGDVFYSSRGPVIGEIAARLSGGYMSGWTLPLASGVNITRIALEIALGKKPVTPFLPTKAWFVEERAVLSFPGFVKDIVFFHPPEELPHFQHWFCRVQPGDEVRFPRNNVEKAGNYIFAGESQEEVLRNTGRAVAWTFIRLDSSRVDVSHPLFFPERKDIPIAYEKNSSKGSDYHNAEELSWDGRTYTEALDVFSRFYSHQKAEEHRILVKILQRFGLQAMVLAADILNNEEKDAVLSEKLYAIYSPGDHSPVV